MTREQKERDEAQAAFILNAGKSEQVDDDLSGEAAIAQLTDEEQADFILNAGKEAEREWDQRQAGLMMSAGRFAAA